MTSPIHTLPCGMTMPKDWGCIDCSIRKKEGCGYWNEGAQEGEMNQRDSKEQELVEEIYEKCDKFYGRLFVYPEIKVSIDERRRFIKQLIARIGQAILSGESEELDEILGVVGRRDLGASPYAPTEWAWTMIGKGARTFVALSPFPRDPLGTGTGKEEEE